jgi:DNA-3-methyladenine glycosylase I
VVRGDGASVTPLSERAAKELKRRGFKFVGPTIVHAWMQAVGIVDDHRPGCFLYRAPEPTGAQSRPGSPSGKKRR